MKLNLEIHHSRLIIALKSESTIENLKSKIQNSVRQMPLIPSVGNLMIGIMDWLQLLGFK